MKTLTIRNTSKKGTLTGSIGGLTAPFSFTAAQGSTFTIPPGAKEPVTLTFTPTAVGPNPPENLVITSDDPNPKHQSESFKVSGTGASGTLSVPLKLTFLPTKVGATPSKNLTIKNTGLGILHGTVGATTGPFTVETGSGSFRLAHLATDVVMIQFTPTAKGVTPPTMLTITSDDPKHQSVIVNLKGTGVVPKVK